MMSIRRTHKIFVIIALAILVVSLLPGAAVVWAGVALPSTETGLEMEPSIPPAQGEGSEEHPPISLDDIIVRYGEEGGDISPQSDYSGIELVPAAAFVHTGELGTGTEADDWFFSFSGGFVTNDSGGRSVCLAAPVYLPPGNIINSFTAYVYDNDSTRNMTIYLDRTGSWGGYAYLAGVQSAGSSTSIQTLTDPSISESAILPEYNYHVDFCLPANSDFNIRIYGARIDYGPSGAPGLSVYLPIIFKNTLPPPVTFSVRNETGGTLYYYKVYNAAPQQGGALLGQCPANIQNGATAGCGTFPSGDLYVETESGCGPGNGSLTFPSGTCTRVVRCGRDNPSIWECN
ncbi:MAG: hypothetical protein AB1801_11695 [Chloroflexota bacterium]